MRTDGRRPLAVLALGVMLLAAACSEQQPPTAAATGTATGAPVTPLPTAPTSATTPATTTTAVTPALARLAGGPVLAVKIDDTDSSRPRIGVGSADVVYVEPVEAGLTRLLAIFSTSMPPEIGPVRSARESDVDLLANYGPVAFAFSGSSGYTAGVLARGRQVNLSFDASRQGYRRAPGRPAPYNVIGNPLALLARAGGSVPPGDPGFRFGPPSPGGSPATRVSTQWPASRIDLVWDPGRRQYLVTADGRPDVGATGAQHAASTVVVQQVPTALSPNRDVNGVQTPVVRVIGQGAVTVVRDGQTWSGQWSRPDAASPTTFSANGQPLAMAAGPVWVLLVPQGQPVTLG